MWGFGPPYPPPGFATEGNCPRLLDIGELNRQERSSDVLNMPGLGGVNAIL